MSYILDALKKAEAERHIGQIPGLHVQPGAALPASPAPGRRLPMQARLVAAAALLAAGAALAWLRPWQAPVPPSLPQPVAQTQAPSAKEPGPTAAPPSFAGTRATAPQIVAISPPPESPRPAARAPEKPRNAAAAPRREASKPATDVTAGSPPATPATTAQARASTNANASDLKISTALTPEPGTSSPRELPEQILRELPNLTIGGYIYSDNPRERQLLVNKRLLHEGEEAAPGVILEKMLPKAAVFNYKGYRYRLAY